MNKSIWFLLFISSCINIYSNEFSIQEYNIRALEDWQNSPANALFYADLAIDKNLEISLKEDYIDSLYIKSLSYKVLEEDYYVLYNLSLAFNYLKDNGYFYTNSDFYLFYANTMFERKEYLLLEQILTTDIITSKLSDQNRLSFDILNIKLNVELNNNIDFGLIDNILNLAEDFETTAHIAEIYLLKADLLMSSNIELAKRNYLNVIKTDNEKFSALAYLRLGEINKNKSYLERSYLLSEKIGDYEIKLQILNSLIDLYEQTGDFKKLAETYQHLDYIRNRHNIFLITQQKEINNYNYEKTKLSNELKKSNSQITFFELIIRFMGVLLVLLIIFLSIQSYRLRIHRH
ncbi:MAG: hypothetical protein OCD02_22405 [Spirochaetaceae bacterium]